MSFATLSSLTSHSVHSSMHHRNYDLQYSSKQLVYWIDYLLLDNKAGIWILLCPLPMIHEKIPNVMHIEFQVEGGANQNRSLQIGQFVTDVERKKGIGFSIFWALLLVVPAAIIAGVYSYYVLGVIAAIAVYNALVAGFLLIYAFLYSSALFLLYLFALGTVVALGFAFLFIAFLCALWEAAIAFLITSVAIYLAVDACFDTYLTTSMTEGEFAQCLKDATT